MTDQNSSRKKKDRYFFFDEFLNMLLEFLQLGSRRHTSRWDVIWGSAQSHAQILILLLQITQLS